MNLNGKRKETYIAFDDLDELSLQIEKRKELENELKELKRKSASVIAFEKVREEALPFRTMVKTGYGLKSLAEPVKKFKKRECVSALREYVFGEMQDKVFVLYGLRRTGKTTMIRQILLEMSDSQFCRAAFI